MIEIDPVNPNAPISTQLRTLDNSTNVVSVGAVPGGDRPLVYLVFQQPVEEMSCADARALGRALIEAANIGAQTWPRGRVQEGKR